MLIRIPDFYWVGAKYVCTFNSAFLYFPLKVLRCSGGQSRPRWGCGVSRVLPQHRDPLHEPGKHPFNQEELSGAATSLQHSKRPGWQTLSQYLFTWRKCLWKGGRAYQKRIQKPFQTRKVKKNINAHDTVCRLLGSLPWMPPNGYITCLDWSKPQWEWPPLLTWKGALSLSTVQTDGTGMATNPHFLSNIWWYSWDLWFVWISNSSSVAL